MSVMYVSLGTSCEEDVVVSDPSDSSSNTVMPNIGDVQLSHGLHGIYPSTQHLSHNHNEVSVINWDY